MYLLSISSKYAMNIFTTYAIDRKKILASFDADDYVQMLIEKVKQYLLFVEDLGLCVGV